MCAGVCERVHQLHHVGGERALPPGEEEDHQRGRHPVRHVHAGLRHVRGAAQALPAEVQRGETLTEQRHAGEPTGFEINSSQGKSGILPLTQSGNPKNETKSCSFFSQRGIMF